MKIFASILLITLGTGLYGQSRVEKTFEVNGIKRVEITTKYPEKILVRQSETGNLKVVAMVSINFGEHDDRFEIKSEKSNEVLKISTEINGLDKLPHRVVVAKDGEEILFQAEDTSDPRVEEFLNEIGNTYSYVKVGVIKDITLEIDVPMDVELVINSKYGLIEIDQIVNGGSFISTYGGVDYTLPLNGMNLKARTKYGDIFTNLDEEFIPEENNSMSTGKWMGISASTGVTSTLSQLESKYGNIYLRKN